MPTIKGPITIGPDMSDADKKKLQDHFSIDERLKNLEKKGILKRGKSEQKGDDK